MARVQNSVTVIKITPIANEVLEVTLTRPAGFEYLAGQFIQVCVPGETGEILRSYSLSSAPHQTKLELCVKLLPDGVGSNFFRALKPGDQINFYGPVGRFTVQSEIDSPLVFVATGSGLAPVMSMLSEVLQNRAYSAPVSLLFGVRTQVDIFWQDRLQALAAQFPNFSHTITLSQPDLDWAGQTGRVTSHLTNLPKAAHYFLCGSGEMVTEVRNYLVAAGEPATSIHFEIF